MLSTAQFVYALSFAVALLSAQPSRAEACVDGPMTPTHRLEAALPLPAGTVRPVVTLTKLQPIAEPTATVVLDGVILPAKAGEAARAAYSDLMAGLSGTPVTLIASADGPDRHGRLHGVVEFDGGDSLGEQILAAGAGLADVSYTPCATRFLAAETRARAEKRGIWRQSRIWTDFNAAATGLPDFVLGRGRVASIGRSGRTTYINFGGNFRTDATVRLREAMTSALVAAGRPPESLSGRIDRGARLGGAARRPRHGTGIAAGLAAAKRGVGFENGLGSSMAGRMGGTGNFCGLASRAAALALALLLAGCLGLSGEDGGVSADQLAAANAVPARQGRSQRSGYRRTRASQDRRGLSAAPTRTAKPS